MPINVKTTDVQIENFNFEKLFNPKFIDLIKENIPDIKLEHFCMYTLDSDKKDDFKVAEHVSVGYQRRKDEPKKLLSIGTTSPEILDKIIKALDEFSKED